MIAFKIICFFLLLPVYAFEGVLKGVAHFISLVWMMAYAMFTEK